MNSQEFNSLAPESEVSPDTFVLDGEYWCSNSEDYVPIPSFHAPSKVMSPHLDYASPSHIPAKGFPVTEH